MKRYLSILLCLVLLGGCQQQPGESSTPAESQPSSVSEESETSSTAAVFFTPEQQASLDQLRQEHLFIQSGRDNLDHTGSGMIEPEELSEGDDWTPTLERPDGKAEATLTASYYGDARYTQWYLNLYPSTKGTLLEIVEVLDGVWQEPYYAMADAGLLEMAVDPERTGAQSLALEDYLARRQVPEGEESGINLPDLPERLLVYGNLLQMEDDWNRLQGRPLRYQMQVTCLAEEDGTGILRFSDFSWNERPDLLAELTGDGFTLLGEEMVPVSLGETTFWTASSMGYGFWDGEQVVRLADAWEDGLISQAMVDEALTYEQDQLYGLYADPDEARVRAILDQFTPLPDENGQVRATLQMLSHNQTAAALWKRWQQGDPAFDAQRTALEEALKALEKEREGEENFYPPSMDSLVPGFILEAAVKDLYGDDAVLNTEDAGDMIAWPELDAYELYGFGYSFFPTRYPVKMTWEGDLLKVDLVTLITSGDSGGPRPLLQQGEDYTWLGEEWRYQPILAEVKASDLAPTDAMTFRRGEDGRLIRVS